MINKLLVCVAFLLPMATFSQIDLQQSNKLVKDSFEYAQFDKNFIGNGVLSSYCIKTLEGEVAAIVMFKHGFLDSAVATVKPNNTGNYTEILFVNYCKKAQIDGIDTSVASINEILKSLFVNKNAPPNLEFKLSPIEVESFIALHPCNYFNVPTNSKPKAKKYINKLKIIAPKP
jgi:hypothetical protein